MKRAIAHCLNFFLLVFSASLILSCATDQTSAENDTDTAPPADLLQQDTAQPDTVQPDTAAGDTAQPDNDTAAGITIEAFGTPAVIASGFLFAEGPVWDSVNNLLLFSDIEKNTIYKLDTSGTCTALITASYKTNGLLLEKAGTLLGASQEKRAILRFTAQSAEVVVGTYNGKKFNAPNDLIQSSSGLIYFTDPMIGLPAGGSELGFAAVYSLAADGTINIESDSETVPNGIALNPGQTHLYVADTTGNAIYKYALSGTGHLENRQLFTTVGSPDGITVDQAGNLYTASHDPKNPVISIFRPDGTVIGSITMPDVPTNLAFGGSDLKTLYITTKSRIVALSAPVAGL